MHDCSETGVQRTCLGRLRPARDQRRRSAGTLILPCLLYANLLALLRFGSLSPLDEKPGCKGKFRVCVPAASQQKRADKNAWKGARQPPGPEPRCQLAWAGPCKIPLVMGSAESPHRAHAQQAAKRHKLLADPTRLEVLWTLSKAPQTVAGLAAALGVHVNTIRAHLDRLQTEGMITQEKGSPYGRGRPARRFHLSEEASRQSDPPGRDYRLLSEVLLGVLRYRSGGELEQEARGSGVRWGRHLASSHSPKPGKEPNPEEAAELVERVFERMQFAPEVQRTERGWDVLLHNCPYKEVARDNQDAVCSFHHGVLEGILKVIGSDLEPESLEPFVRPDVCRASLVESSVQRKRDNTGLP